MIFTNQRRLFVAMATVILGIGLASCGAGRRGTATVANTNDTAVLDYPVIDRYSSGGTLDIRRIVLTDSSTTIHFSAKYRPKNWIFIDTASCIIAKNGKKLRMTGHSGCLTPGKKYFMPENGRDSFALVFPPLPAGTESIDFIESESKNGFKLFGIDMTGRESVKQFQDLPDELETFPDRDTPLPYPQFTAGKTTVVFHYPEGSERYVKSVNLIVNRLLQQRLEMDHEIDSLFDMTDPRLLEGGNAEYLVYGVNDSNVDWKAVLGDRGKLLYDLKDADLIYIPRIKAGSIKDEELRKFIEEDLREFTSHCHPFAAAILKSMDSELAEARKTGIYKSGFKDVPEGSGEELFDKIVAPYKGKIRPRGFPEHVVWPVRHGNELH